MLIQEEAISQELAAEDSVRQMTQVMSRPGDPCIMVICGASGDLTKRKLIPALYNLAAESLLSKEFALVGFARRKIISWCFAGNAR